MTGPSPHEQPSKLFWWTLGRQRDPADANRMRAPSKAGAIATILIAVGLLGIAVLVWIELVPAVAVVVGLLGLVLLVAGITGWRESRWERPLR